jgi:hypothetical protein
MEERFVKGDALSDPSRCGETAGGPGRSVILARSEGLFSPLSVEIASEPCRSLVDLVGAGPMPASRSSLTSRCRDAIVAAVSQLLACAVVIGCMLTIVGLPMLEVQPAQEEGAREKVAQSASVRSEGRNETFVAREAIERAIAERELGELRQEIAREQAVAEAERRSAQEANSRISQIERTSGALQRELAWERSARDAAEHALRGAQLAQEKLKQERNGTAILGWRSAPRRP